MQRQGNVSGAAKRKRRSSDSCANIENEPINEAKKLKEDRTNNEHSCDERLPLTELPILHLHSSKDCHDYVTDDYLDKNTYANALSQPDFLNNYTDSEYFMSCENGDFPGPSSSGFELSFEVSSSKPKHCFGWLNEKDIWEFYCNETESAVNLRASSLFTNHPNLQPRMRSVLLEWIIEVCDVYKLHRETYYLALDYLDRYLSVTKEISKNQLQLIGVTCLLVAAKYEEIYPPKISEFAYITDGACSEEEIIKMELIMIKMLDWRCTIISANNWLSVFMQLIYHKNSQQKQDIMIPQYSVKLFEKVSHLLDLVSLDEGFLHYPYKIHAISALYLAFSKHLALAISGMELTDICACVNWMEAFWEVLQEKYGYEEDNCGLLTAGQQSKCVDFSHTILKHTVSLELLEAGQTILSLKAEQKDPSSVGLLTPPSSSKKSFGPENL